MMHTLLLRVSFEQHHAYYDNTPPSHNLSYPIDPEEAKRERRCGLTYVQVIPHQEVQGHDCSESMH